MKLNQISENFQYNLYEDYYMKMIMTIIIINMAEFIQSCLFFIGFHIGFV